jgi:PIF1-like helicase/Helix-turn-helix domain/HRDC domain
MKNSMEKNERLELAGSFVKFTGKHIFLTGKAGTGKTTFLRTIREETSKRWVVVAPTGVAAINAGGVTIHSFFQLPFGPIIPGRTEVPAKKEGHFFQAKFSKQKIDIIRSLDLLIIDEISMVRADLLDGIDEVLRRYKDRRKPFGGVQLLMIGDLQQLSPVVKQDEWEMIRNYYDTPYFFSSNALKKTNYISILLEHVYRQTDQHFLDILNKVRNNRIDHDTLLELNKRFIPGFIQNPGEGYIILTTHNAQAKQINTMRLENLKTSRHIMEGMVSGDFPEYTYPTDLDLELKEDAQVMFVKNDSSSEKLYYNGKIGIIDEILEDQILVRCEDEDELIPVYPVEWQNIKYSLDNKTHEISERVAGTFTQFPLKLAWAITIHKSQGLTFEKAIIDAKAAFAHGQVYVALSRCKTLEGMVLNSTLDAGCFINDNQVSGFTQKAEEEQPTKSILEKAKNEYEKELLLELFNMGKMMDRLEVLISIVKKHQSGIAKSPLDLLQKIKVKASKELEEVQQKFESQVNSLTNGNHEINENKALDERVKKATVYFKDKIEEIISKPLTGISIESDNKETKKLVSDGIDKLNREIHVKTQCLASAMVGFNVSDYLKAKVKSEMEKLRQASKRVRDTFEDSSDQMLNPGVYSRLIQWRNKKAEEEGVPHFMIVHVKALINIANIMPASYKELKKIKGIGKKTIEKFGREILELMGHQVNEDFLLIKESKPKSQKKSSTKKGASLKISLGLFRDGNTIEEIAKKRNLSIVTIEGHLAEQIGLGMIKPDELMSAKKMKLIMDYFSNTEDRALNPAKESLGESISYAELRFVREYMNSLMNKGDQG